MKLLDVYYDKQQDFYNKVKTNQLKNNELMEMQEVGYRIYVLDTFQTFLRTAPICKDLQILGNHFVIVRNFTAIRVAEPIFGLKTDEAGEKKRETAKHGLREVFDSIVRKFSKEYNVKDENQFKVDLCNFINAFLAAWIEYRQTFISIKIQEAKK